MSADPRAPPRRASVADPGPVAAIVDALDAEQRAAATLPDGPAQIIAPAGSGKTTTMVARLAVLVSRGVSAERICVVTFNRDAALDLESRVRRRLGGLVDGSGSFEIRTLHALARRVMLDADRGADVLPDRLPLLRQLRRSVLAADGSPRADDGPPTTPDAGALDTLISAWKVEGREPPPQARALVDAYQAALRERGLVDFDDLVIGAGDLLERDARIRSSWQARFSHVCVDEFQDVDAAQLRLVRLLAAPENNLFVVGDDDQTIYAWRLADVRRILRFGDEYPTARRVMLATNYRCPAAIVEASARLIAFNRERFAKPIRPAPAVLAHSDTIEAIAADAPHWSAGVATLAAAEVRAGRTCCVLARTRTELLPVAVALILRSVPHASAAPLPVESDRVDELVGDIESGGADRDAPPFDAVAGARRARGWVRGDPRADDLPDEELAALDALHGWAVAYDDLAEFVAAVRDARARVASVRVADAPVELATVHGSKGREWETVVLIGFEEDRIPNRRALTDADDRQRALEEERRLAYVAVTRATRRLVLAFDPARPSPFLAEMGYAARR